MRKFLAMIVCCLWAAGVVSPSFAQDHEATLAAALEAQDWQGARAAAAAMDGAETGDFYGLYVEARSLAVAGRCTEAIFIFDLLASGRPYFTPAYEGAFVCLERMGQDEQAIARLDTLLAVMPQGAQRDVIFQVRQQVASRDRPVFNVFGEVTPSSNATRQTDETALGPFLIRPESQGRPGFLGRLGTSLTAKVLATPSLAMSAILKGELAYNSAVNVLEPRATLETPLSFKASDTIRVLLTPYATAALGNGRSVHHGLGGRGVVSVTLSDAVTASLSGEAEYSMYPQANFRDGWQYELSGSTSWLVSPQTMLTLTGTVEWDQADDPTRRSVDLSMMARIDQAMDSGLLIGAEGTLGRTFHTSPAPLQVGAGQEDIYGAVRLELSHLAITFGPFMPQVFYEYKRRDSDNVFYRYESHDVGLGLRAKF